MKGSGNKCLICFLAVVSLAYLGACNNRIHTTYVTGSNPNYVYQKPKGDNPHYSYISQAVPDVTVGVTDINHEHYDVRDLAFASAGSNGQVDNQVEAYYFKSRTHGKKPLVIVLPIWGIHKYPSEKISLGYADHAQGDAHIIWVQGEKPLFDWRRFWSTRTENEFIAEARASVQRFETTIIDLRRLLDWVETQPEIDASRIGLIGFSIGALMAANIVANEPRVETAVFMMGGAYPWEIFATCGFRIGKVRKHAMTKLGWSRDQYRNFLREILAHGDPVNWAGRYNPERILIIEAGKDRCVPKISREAFWVATGKPERISLQYDHGPAFLSMTPLGFNYSADRIYEFFDRKLVQQNRRSQLAESHR